MPIEELAPEISVQEYNQMAHQTGLIPHDWVIALNERGNIIPVPDFMAQGGVSWNKDTVKKVAFWALVLVLLAFAIWFIWEMALRPWLWPQEGLRTPIKDIPSLRGTEYFLGAS